MLFLKGTGTLSGIKAKTGVASGGASIKMDVRIGSNVPTSSIFTDDEPLEIAIGSTSVVTDTNIDNGAYNDSVLYVTLTQVGSTVS